MILHGSWILPTVDGTLKSRKNSCPALVLKNRGGVKHTVGKLVAGLQRLLVTGSNQVEHKVLGSSRNPGLFPRSMRQACRGCASLGDTLSKTGRATGRPPLRLRISGENKD